MNTQRLKVLADHLRHGKLGHEVFDFSVLNTGAPYMDVCGTNGCAMGELPICFPNEWRFVNDSIELMEGGKYRAGVMTFFDITADMLDYLFIPADEDEYSNMYGSFLFADATKEMVADRIDQVINDYVNIQLINRHFDDREI